MGRLGAGYCCVDPSTLNNAILECVAVWNYEQKPQPVPGTDTVPVLSFMFIVIVVTIIIGPINFFWVRKRQNPILLLVTTPIIATVAVVLVIAVGLLSDGIERQRFIQQIMLLDQERQQATSWSHNLIGTFAAGAFPVPANTHLRISGFFDGYSYRNNADEERFQVGVGYQQGQRMAVSGWVPARQQRSLDFTTVHSERRKLSVERQDGIWVITNYFDQPITRIIWRDQRGAAWQASDIAPQGQAPLQRVSDELSEHLKTLDPTLRRQQRQEVDSLVTTILDTHWSAQAARGLRLSSKPLSCMAEFAGVLHLVDVGGQPAEIAGPSSVDARTPVSYLITTVTPTAGPVSTSVEGQP